MPQSEKVLATLGAMMQMKYFLVLTAVLGAACGLDQDFIDKFKEKVMKVGEECMTEVGATTDDIEEIVQNKIPSTHEGKCLLACAHKKFGIQGADGKIDETSAISSMSKLQDADAEIYGKMKNMFETCFGEVTNDADECVTAANWMVCIHKEKKQNGLDTLFKM